jgi:redox-sensitive bicupin YhaK (pirin superfamily)
MTAKPRSVVRVIEPSAVIEGAGVRLKRSMPTRQVDYLDPFLLFDDFSSDDPTDFYRGFPWHPHRGIETVTYVLRGAVNHHDSLGNAGSIGAGDIQWMTAGSGIMHEEMPQAEAGPLTGFQLWVNLPARQKMTRPRYQDIQARNVPEVTTETGARVRVIAGQAAGADGPVTDIMAQPIYQDVSLSPGDRFVHAVEPGHTVFAYVVEGAGQFGVADGNDGETVSRRRLVVFSDGDSVAVGAEKDPVRFLLISGKPLHEPVARYGPFVMNTQEEIRETLRDLRNGTFIREQPETDPESWYGRAGEQG